MKTLFRTALALAASAFIAASAVAQTTPAKDWKTEWDKTVAAANKEGALVISAPSGQIWREQLMTFNKAYPNIKLELTPAASRDFWPRVIKEREAGQSLWDFRVGGPDNLVYQVKAMGYMTSVRDMLLLPEVLDDSAWYGGIDGIFLDKEKMYFLGFAIYEENIAYYNKRVLPDPSVADLKNIVDPKFAGKISMADPRAGSPLTASGSMLKAYGEDFLRKLVTQQKPVIVRDPRSQMEWLASGRYPISIGVPTAALVEYEKRGISIADFVNMAGPRTWTQGVGGIQALKDAPHPNATKVFVNWLLTKDVQTQIMTAVKLNSRRKDVPLGDPESAIDYAKLDEYVGGQTEVMQPYQKRASEIYRELLKQ
ncbi:MAG: ABC transporter substrate-binding protein [Gemmatimonas sp.]